MKKLILLFFIMVSGFSQQALANMMATASQISTVTSGYSKNLNSTDTDQQKVDNAVDQLNTITGSPHQCNAGNFPSGIDTAGNAINCAPAGSGSAITALTGDLTATGPGSVPAILATVNSNVGSFTNANITVNAKGLITAATNGTAGGVTSVTASSPLASSGGNTPNITFTNPGYITGNQTITLSGDATGSGATSIPVILSTVNSNVGSYTNANITVNAKGLITSAANGTAGGVTSVTGTAPIVSSGGSTPAISIPAATNSVNGYLTSADHTTFSNIVSSQWTSVAPGINYSGGNVGIGSANPGQKLDVQGTIRTKNFTLSGNNAASGYILQSSGALGIGTWVPEPSGGGTNYWTATGPDITNNNSGNVGIGITSPQNQFVISNSNTDPNVTSMVMQSLDNLGQIGIGFMVNGILQGIFRGDYAGGLTFNAADNVNILTGGLVGSQVDSYTFDTNGGLYNNGTGNPIAIHLEAPNTTADIGDGENSGSATTLTVDDSSGNINTNYYAAFNFMGGTNVDSSGTITTPNVIVNNGAVHTDIACYCSDLSLGYCGVISGIHCTTCDKNGSSC